MQPDQVQEFIPIPMTISTAMFVSGLDPFSMEPLNVSRGDRERRMQKALIHSQKPDNRKLVLEALQRTGRMDLADKLLHGSVEGPNHLQERARRGGYVGPTFMAGGSLDQIIDEDEARMDEHDGHFPEPGAEQVSLACGTKVPKQLAEAANRGGYNVSWRGKKKTATIKTMPRRKRS
jgi:hypothetical protein